MKRYNKLGLSFTCLFIFMIISISLAAQNKKHVFTREIVRTFDWRKSKNIIVDAEKADINIYTTDKNQINIVLKFIAKHKERSIAKDQLEYLKHVVNENKKEIFLHNYILVNENEELKASIKAVYNIGIPDNIHMTIKNTMGNLIMSNVAGTFNIEVKYGKIKLENIAGKLDLNHHVGDLSIKNSDLNAIINTKHVTTNLGKIGGKYEMVTNLGTINASINKDIDNITIESEGTDIHLTNKKCAEFNLNLNSNMGSLYIDQCYIHDKTWIKTDNRKENSNLKIFIYQNNQINRVLKIENKYSNIYLN